MRTLQIVMKQEYTCDELQMNCVEVEHGSADRGEV